MGRMLDDGENSLPADAQNPNNRMPKPADFRELHTHRSTQKRSDGHIVEQINVHRLGGVINDKFLKEDASVRSLRRRVLSFNQRDGPRQTIPGL